MRLRLPFSPRHLLLVPLSAVMLLPLVWMLLTSIQTLPESRHFPPQLIPSGIHWQNYPDAWNAAPFGRYFANSLVVTLASVAGNLVFCSLAGYAFARLRFFGRDVLFVVLLATLMVPFQVTMIPTFLAGTNWVMHWVEGADHSFHVLKSSGRTDADALNEIQPGEAAGVVVLWDGWAPFARADRHAFDVAVDVFDARVDPERVGTFAVLLKGPGPQTDLVELDLHRT